MVTGSRSRIKHGEFFHPPPAPMLKHTRKGVTEQLREAMLMLTNANEQGLVLNGDVPGVYLLVQSLEAILGYRLHAHCTVWDFVRSSADTMAEDDVQVEAPHQHQL